MCQETFIDERGAREFGALVDRVGGAAARQVLEARREKADTTPTLREWTTRYLDPTSGLLTGVEPGTRGGYRRAAERSFLPILGDYPIDAITKTDIGKWVEWQEQQQSTARAGQLVAAKTVRNYHAILSSVLAAAVHEGLRGDNPAYRTRLSKGVKREGVFLSPEEFATLLHFIPPRYQGLVMFLAGTGCRWGEATALTWGDINTTSAPPTVRIDKAWKKADGAGPVLKHPKSSRSRRTISLTPDVLEAIGDAGPSTELVFPGVFSGGHLWYGRFRTSTWVPAVAKAMDRGVCEVEGVVPLRVAPNIHDLRHSHASWLIAAGVPLTFVQARLGHESIMTTSNVYGHLQPDAHVQMADVVAATLAGVRGLRAVAG
jgi:integrase